VYGAASRLYFLYLSGGQCSDVDDDKWEIMDLCRVTYFVMKRKRRNNFSINHWKKSRNRTE
jgi:hypothetical protein